MKDVQKLAQLATTIIGRFNPIYTCTIRGLKAPPPIFCPHVFNFEATLLCVEDFSKKIVYHRVAKQYF